MSTEARAGLTFLQERLYPGEGLILLERFREEYTGSCSVAVA
jgi:hypothetical protein